MFNYSFKVYQQFDLYDFNMVLCGALTRTRTANLLITNQLLYQLSYEGLETCFNSIKKKNNTF